YFGFELSDSLRSAVRTGSAAGLLTGFLRLQDTLPAYRWSPFLTNHDQTRTLTALGGEVARARLAATLLLTLPGLPFIYYGEEIGMTGNKPDPRLRTPMQWSPRPGAGFTSGKPWEAPQPDSLTTNVAVEDRDPRQRRGGSGREAEAGSADRRGGSGRGGAWFSNSGARGGEQTRSDKHRRAVVSSPRPLSCVAKCTPDSRKIRMQCVAGPRWRQVLTSMAIETRVGKRPCPWWTPVW